MQTTVTTFQYGNVSINFAMINTEFNMIESGVEIKSDNNLFSPIALVGYEVEEFEDGVIDVEDFIQQNKN